MRSLVLGLSGLVAIVIAIVSWHRALTFDQPTTAHQVRWLDSNNQPIDTSGANSIGDSSTRSAIVIGDRVIVKLVMHGASSAGFAWIHPTSGTAKIAWPVDPALDPDITGMVVRDPDTFALVMTAHEPGGGAIWAGIAGRDGWQRPPERVTRWSGLDRGALLLGSSWVDGELEVVTTHPEDKDSFGLQAPVDITRLPIGGPAQARRQVMDCPCLVDAAIPGPKTWRLIAYDMDARTWVAIGARGERSPAPFHGRDVDRSAFGTFGGLSTGARRIELDGSGTDVRSPLPGWELMLIGGHVEVIDGVVRSVPLWHAPGHAFDRVARQVGDRAIITSYSDHEHALVGTTPDTLTPVIAGLSASSFNFGVFVRRSGGGYYWVQGEGDYVTLDDELQRIDGRKLGYHLRTRGSVGNFIDEPSHVWLFGWALLALPILLAIGVIGQMRGRRNAVPVMLALYAITGGVALLKVLPLL